MRSARGRGQEEEDERERGIGREREGEREETANSETVAIFAANFRILPKPVSKWPSFLRASLSSDINVAFSGVHEEIWLTARV